MIIVNIGAATTSTTSSGIDGSGGGFLMLIFKGSSFWKGRGLSFSIFLFYRPLQGGRVVVGVIFCEGEDAGGVLDESVQRELGEHSSDRF